MAHRCQLRSLSRGSQFNVAPEPDHEHDRVTGSIALKSFAAKAKRGRKTSNKATERHGSRCGCKQYKTLEGKQMWMHTMKTWLVP